VRAGHKSLLLVAATFSERTRALLLANHDCGMHSQLRGKRPQGVYIKLRKNFTKESLSGIPTGGLPHSAPRAED
jgi:hypothetical protein